MFAEDLMDEIDDAELRDQIAMQPGLVATDIDGNVDGWSTDQLREIVGRPRPPCDEAYAAAVWWADAEAALRYIKADAMLRARRRDWSIPSGCEKLTLDQARDIGLVPDVPHGQPQTEAQRRRAQS